VRRSRARSSPTTRTAPQAPSSVTAATIAAAAMSQPRPAPRDRDVSDKAAPGFCVSQLRVGAREGRNAATRSGYEVVPEHAQHTVKIDPPERGWRLLSERGSSSFPDRGLRAGPRRQDGTALAPATQPPPMARRLVAADLITLATGVVRAVDPLVVALAAWIAYWARHGSWVLPDLYMIAIAAACVLTLNIMQLGRVYAFENLSRLPTQVGRLAWAWTAVILVLIALAYFTQTSLAFSRAFVLGWIAISFGFLLIVRVLFLLRVDAWRRDGRLSLQAEALRLQQRADRGLQVPLDVRRPERRRGRKLVTKDDPRVTRVGRFIRKTSIDELPQLFNVSSRATCRWSARARTRCRPRRRPALRRGRRRLFRPPPGQARHHRLGADQRLARRDRHGSRRSSSASSTTSTTSRTGRCCSTSTSWNRTNVRRVRCHRPRHHRCRPSP
jgi:hypothetical protein